MTEKLYPLQVPPGIRRTGTVYQSRDRWYGADLVRFTNGTIQPVGGWVKRTLTGAAITGTPNAAISWTTNDGDSYLAIGTTTNLYVVTSANVVYDITPTSAIGSAPPYTWQLETFGTYLIAVLSEVNRTFPYVNSFAWTGTLSSPATVTHDGTTGPNDVYGVAVTPERFLVFLRGQPTFASGHLGTPIPVGPDGVIP